MTQSKLNVLGKIEFSNRERTVQMPHVIRRVEPRSNLVPVVSGADLPGPKLVPAPNFRRLMGRKGRKAQAKRRMLDGLLLVAVAAVVAVIWWSAP